MILKWKLYKDEKSN